jgi:hypothetical protein
MTARIRVRDVLRDKILVSRESAHLLARPLRQAISDRRGDHGAADTAVTVDFEGVEGMAPAFLDEFLAVLESTLGGSAKICFVSQPTRLSLKFEAVARSRGLRVVQEHDGSWLLEAKTAPVT